MKLGALSISDYAAERLGAHGPTGSVHSVFRTSLNVEFDGMLFHIGSTDAPLSCLGVSVDVGDVSRLVGIARQGDRAIFREGVLRLYCRGAVEEIDFAHARIRDLSVPSVSPYGLENLDIRLYPEISGMNLPARIGLPWDERASRSLAGLARLSSACYAAWDAERTGVSIPHERIEGALRDARGAIAHLLGRGLGLTPSGDDVLCGFGCGLCYQWRADSAGFDAWHEFSAEVLKALPGRTTAVSEAYLVAMCEGYANEDYIGLLDAMGSNDRRQLGRALAKVLEMGHTSGADSLLGFAASFCCLPEHAVL